MEALRSAYDSDSEPDANSKPLASVNDAAVAQVDAAGTHSRRRRHRRNGFSSSGFAGRVPNISKRSE